MTKYVVIAGTLSAYAAINATVIARPPLAVVAILSLFFRPFLKAYGCLLTAKKFLDILSCYVMSRHTTH